MTVYLYIKWHPTDPSTRTDGRGLFYLGKTLHKNLEKYKGGGLHWNNHINKYGRNKVETIWYCLFTEKEEIKEFALMVSEQWNIVTSDLWANLKFEDGLRGGSTVGNKLRPRSLEQIANSKGHTPWNKGKKIGPLSNEHKAKLAIQLKGKPQLLESRVKRSISMKKFIEKKKAAALQADK